jgi:hypothetical protein
MTHGQCSINVTCDDEKDTIKKKKFVNSKEKQKGDGTNLGETSDFCDNSVGVTVLTDLADLADGFGEPVDFLGSGSSDNRLPEPLTDTSSSSSSCLCTESNTKHIMTDQHQNCVAVTSVTQVA